MSNSLPENANLDHLKGQAKALFHSLKASEKEALARAANLGFGPPFPLAKAQSILAKAYGFASWTRLKREVEVDRPLFERLAAAVRGGDRETVQALAVRNPALLARFSKSDFDAPLLNLAAGRNDFPMVCLLVELGVDVNARSTWWAGGFGALDFTNEQISDWLIAHGAILTPHAAARLGKVEELRKMLEANPGLVRERGGDGQFPLHFAKTPEVVDLLVDAGADLEARDLDHHGTALQFRILDEDVRKALLRRGAQPDIFSAVIEDDPIAVAQLLERDPEAPDRKTTSPGNPQIPQAPGGHIYLYQLGALQPHQVAFGHGRNQAWVELWERAEDPKRLAMAAWAEDREAAIKLTLRTPELASRLSRADLEMLPDAAWERRVGAVRLMLELGWPVDAVQGEHSSAVDRAAFHGFDDVIEAVLPFHPNLAQRNTYGGTPLGACLYGSIHSWRKDGNHVRSVELLLRAGAPPPDRVYGSAEVREILAKWGF